MKNYYDILGVDKKASKDESPIQGLALDGFECVVILDIVSFHKML